MLMHNNVAILMKFLSFVGFVWTVDTKLQNFSINQFLYTN